MTRCGRRTAAIAAALGLVLPLGPCLARAGEGAEPEVDVVELDEPVFPLMREAVRLWFESEFIPEAPLDAGGADVSLIKPGVRGRIRAPVGRLVSTQLSAGFSTSRYDFDGGSSLFAACAACPEPDEFYAASLALQGALLLNPAGRLLFEGERWGLLGAGFGRARWEPGAFEDSLTAGGELGLGYQLPGRLRIAGGVRVETALDGGKPSISPSGSFRWDVTGDLRLRSRGLGAQLEWRQRRFEVFATGYRTSDRFVFHARSGAPNDVLFRDRQWRAGAGIEWKLFRRLRVLAEAGAVVDRELSLRARGEGTLAEVTGDPSPYANVRVEVRP